MEEKKKVIEVKETKKEGEECCGEGSCGSGHGHYHGGGCRCCGSGFWKGLIVGVVVMVVLWGVCAMGKCYYRHTGMGCSGKCSTTMQAHPLMSEMPTAPSNPTKK